MDINISLDKDTILTEVRRTSQYIGDKAGTDDDYLNIGLTKANNEQLDRFRYDAVSNIREALKRYIKSVGTTEERIVLDMPSTYSENAGESLADSLNTYCIEYILAKWLEVVGRQDWQIHATRYEEAMKAAIEQLNMRNRPTRTALSDTTEWK